MIFIGSRALKNYINLNRKLHDWDFLMTLEEIGDFNRKYLKYQVKSTSHSLVYDILGEIVEVTNPENLDYSDKILLRTKYRQIVETPFGSCYLPQIETLYDIKKATALFIEEPKHKHDQQLIEIAYPHLKDVETGFFEMRRDEIKNRIAKSNKVMYDFFHNEKISKIPEYILHDRLHIIISDLLGLSIPTYQRITTAETDISENLFNKLTHKQKIDLMVEESLVLNLERWMVPQFVEQGINYRLIDMFYNNNEAMPTYKILKHVNLTGLKGEAKYITDFGKANFFEIEKEWIAAKEKIKCVGGFPKSFFEELFALREKFKRGVEIGYHNKKLYE